MNTKKQFAPSHGGAYLKVKKASFDFGSAKKKYNDEVASKDEILEDMEEKPKPFKVILSFVCIGIALILGYVESQNIKATLIGNGTLSEGTAIVIGFGFACMGLITGELLSSGFKRDEFTGKRKPTGKWYIGLLLTVIYISGQYYLASRAGIGASEDLQETVNTMKIFVLGIAITEVLFGALFLKTAFQTFTLFIANLRIKIAIRKMNNTAHQTEEWWQRYIYDLQNMSNTQNTTIKPAEETEAIKLARQYYNAGGIEHTSANNSKN